MLPPPEALFWLIVSPIYAAGILTGYLLTGLYDKKKPPASISYIKSRDMVRLCQKPRE